MGFDSGAASFAKSKGIGLCRWVPAGSIVMMAEDTQGPSDEEVVQALVTAKTSGFRFPGWLYALTCDGALLADLPADLRAEFEDV